MQIDLIFKIAGIGIVVAIINQILARAGRDEQATLVAIAGVIAVLAVILQQFASLFNTVKSLFGM